MFYKILLNTGREVFIQAQNKGAATQKAIEEGKLDKFDLFDIEEILTITEIEYNRGLGIKIQNEPGNQI